MFALVVSTAQALLLPQAGIAATWSARSRTIRAIVEPTTEPTAEVSNGTFAFDIPSIVIGGGRIGTTLMELGCEGEQRAMAPGVQRHQRQRCMELGCKG